VVVADGEGVDLLVCKLVELIYSVAHRIGVLANAHTSVLVSAGELELDRVIELLSRPRGLQPKLEL